MPKFIYYSYQFAQGLFAGAVMLAPFAIYAFQG